MWRISIHRDFDSLGGDLSPCGSHWLRLEPFTQIHSRTLCTDQKTIKALIKKLNCYLMSQVNYGECCSVPLWLEYENYGKSNLDPKLLFS